MPDLQSELNELKGFIADLKADRAGAKEKEKREGWTKYVSLTIVIIAVFAAIASQWAGKYSSRTLAKLNDATFYQAKASDQWSYYQAKSIKQNLYEISRSQLQASTGADAAKLQKEFDDKIAKYEKDKADLTEAAKQQEKLRDEARDAANVSSKLGSEMGLAVSLFSVAIAMTSICLVTKKKPLWFIAMTLAALAIGKMVAVWMH
jgi:hypothetical protein